MQRTQSRQHHRIYVLFFRIIGGTEPSLTLDSGAVDLDIHSIGSSINGRWVAGINTTRAVEFFPQCDNETIQVLDVGFSILLYSLLQTSIGLISQGVGGSVWKKMIFDIGLSIKCISDAELN